MTIYVVVHQTGGWSGTETYTRLAYAFSERAHADAYVAEYKRLLAEGLRHDNLDQFEIEQVELLDRPAHEE